MTVIILHANFLLDNRENLCRFTRFYIIIDRVYFRILTIRKRTVLLSVPIGSWSRHTFYLELYKQRATVAARYRLDYRY